MQNSRVKKARLAIASVLCIAAALPAVANAASAAQCKKQAKEAGITGKAQVQKFVKQCEKGGSPGAGGGAMPGGPGGGPGAP